MCPCDVMFVSDEKTENTRGWVLLIMKFSFLRDVMMMYFDDGGGAIVQDADSCCQVYCAYRHS